MFINFVPLMQLMMVICKRKTSERYKYIIRVQFQRDMVSLFLISHVHDLVHLNWSSFSVQVNVNFLKNLAVTEKAAITFDLSFEKYLKLRSSDRWSYYFWVWRISTDLQWHSIFYCLKNPFYSHTQKSREKCFLRICIED